MTYDIKILYRGTPTLRYIHRSANSRGHAEILIMATTQSSQILIPPIQVSSTVYKVMTPLQPDVWYHMLASYPKQDLINFFIEGITRGFWIGFNYQYTTFTPYRYQRNFCGQGYHDISPTTGI